MAATATSMPGSDIADILRRVDTPTAQAQQSPPSELLQQRIARGERALKEIPALFDLEQRALEERTRIQQEKEKRISQEESDLERGVSGQLQQARRVRAEMTMPDPEFKPSQMEMDDYRNLAGMLVGIGMLAGGTGRNSAMYALNSLNGMMKGYAEGRRDLFKNEQIKFDKQLRSIDATNKRIQREFEDAVAMIGTDRAEGLARIKRLSAELNQGVIDADLRLSNLAGVRKHFDSLVSASNSAVKLLESRAAEVAAREARREDRMEAEASRRAFQREMEENRRAFQREMQSERQSGQTTRQGQNNLAFASRVFANTLNAANDLRNVINLPSVSQSPILSGMLSNDATTVFSSLANAAARSITKSEERAFDQIVSGLSIALARIESQGLASGATNYIIKQYDQLKPRAGDKAIHMALWLAKVRQEIETGIQTHSRMPGATPGQIEDLGKALQQVRTAVPFTVENATEVIRRGRTPLGDRSNALLNVPSITNAAVQQGAATLDVPIPSAGVQPAAPAVPTRPQTPPATTPPAAKKQMPTGTKLQQYANEHFKQLPENQRIEAAKRFLTSQGYTE